MTEAPGHRGDAVWVSWPLPIASLPRRVLAVVTCRYDPAKDDPANHHHHGTCRVWVVDFGNHEWAYWPLDLPNASRDLGTLEPIDRDAEREIEFLLGDARDAFLDTLAGWPPASNGWDAVRGNAHRLGEVLARALTPELMRLYWQVDGRFFRWVEVTAELDVMGRGGRFRLCAKNAPTTFDRDGIRAHAIASMVPAHRDGCLRLVSPFMVEGSGTPKTELLPPRFVFDVDPDTMAFTGATPPERYLGSFAPDAVAVNDAPDVEARVALALPQVMSLFVRRRSLSGDERDVVIAYEDDFFVLHDKKLEPVYRGLAPDFFAWLDEVRAGAHTPL